MIDLKGSERQESLSGDEEFMHKMVMSEEQRRRDYPYSKWTPGQYRWFETTNVIDLWRLYSATERSAICQRLRPDHNRGWHR
jgi:hypothetical protein